MMLNSLKTTTLPHDSLDFSIKNEQPLNENESF